MAEITWLTVEQAREEAGVSRRTIYNWLHAGKLGWRRTVGGSLRIVRDSLFEGYAGPVVPCRKFEARSNARGLAESHP